RCLGRGLPIAVLSSGQKGRRPSAGHGDDNTVSNRRIKTSYHEPANGPNKSAFSKGAAAGKDFRWSKSCRQAHLLLGDKGYRLDPVACIVTSVPLVSSRSTRP